MMLSEGREGFERATYGFRTSVRSVVKTKNERKDC